MGTHGRCRQKGLTLAEVLIAASVGVIITGMLIAVWIALTGSWTVTARGSEARDFARDSVARMSREIRDMEPAVGEPSAISMAEADCIRFTTTFNVSGNQSVSTTPVLTEYKYEPGTGDEQGVLRWSRDTNGSGVIDDEDRDRIVARNVLNNTSQPMFVYTYLDSAAQSHTSSSVPTAELSTIQVVDVRVIVDMQPGRAPKPMDLTTTVQLRNQQ